MNARGTYTILTGSTALPEVRAAMEAASHHYVHLDELAEAIGKRLAELTGAEWGMVTNGCSAALTHATVACLTGGNPDLHVRLPDLRGFPKDECIIPKHSRNVYDAALRATGVKVIEVGTADELEAAFGPRTALAYILAGPRADDGPTSTKAVCEAARKRGVPVLVDAAAEILRVPNVHLTLGADLVGYSGGKCLRGPQAAGLLLGRKDLVKAAWVGSAPHHGFGRGFKVGKEEALGMLMAVEMWMRRDHDAEWKQWQAWIDFIARRVETLPGVTTSVTQPDSLSNRMPSLQIRWDKAALGVSGEAVARQLFESAPRVSVFPARGRPGGPPENGVSIGPYMMAAGDERVVAERIVAALKSPVRVEAKPPAPPAGDVTGSWDVRIQYAATSSTHALYLRQRGSEIDGMHQGDFVTREARGTIDGSSRADPQLLPRVPWRLAQLRLQRHARGRHDRGRAGHGRVPEGPLHGEAPREPQELWRMNTKLRALAAALGCALLSATAFAADPPYDLLLAGGHVIDAKSGTSAVRDVAIAGGKIAAVAPRIDPAQAFKVVDVSGLYVTPGLIDLHVHVYTGTGEKNSYAGDNSLYPDGFMLRVGVTTVVDAGCSGWRNFEDFKDRVIDRSRTRVLALLNIVGNGMRGASSSRTSTTWK